MSRSGLAFSFLSRRKDQDRSYHTISDQSNLCSSILDVGKALLATRTFTVYTVRTVYSAVHMSISPVCSAFVCSEGKLGNADEEESKDEFSGHFELVEFAECCCSCVYLLLLLLL